MSLRVDDRRGFVLVRRGLSRFGLLFGIGWDTMEAKERGVGWFVRFVAWSVGM